MLDHSQILAVAKAAATLAGSELLKFFADPMLEMRDKTASGGVSYDLVSDADLTAEKVVAQCILQSFPDHSLLGEETLGTGMDVASQEHLWIIDPLDGTNNFAHRLPNFAVSIAYYHRGVAQVGVVYAPALSQWYTTVRGQGAWHNDQPAQVSAHQQLSKVLIGCGFYYDRGEMMRRTLASIEQFFGHDIHGIRRFGAASLDLCMVGCGQFGGFFEYRLSPWDFAAGRLFVEEAGGKVTTATGAALELKPTSVVASNGSLHDAMLKITAPYCMNGSF